MSGAIVSPANINRAILVAHLTVFAGWLGGVLAMLALVWQASPRSDLAAFLVNDLVVWSSLAVLVTSTAFALWTPWGFFRFRFIVVKWCSLASLAVLGVFFRTPAVNALAAHADVYASVLGTAGERGTTVAMLAVEAIVLLAVAAISVWRPWGRTRPGRTATERALPRSVRAAIASCVLVAVALGAAQSMALDRLRRTPLPTISLRDTADGAFEGEAQVGVHARVRVVVGNGRLLSIDVLDLPRGRYAELARGVTRKMLTAQRLDVDGVTGATTTSRAVQAATASALLTGARASPGHEPSGIAR